MPGTDYRASALQAGGNMEGKEVRFGVANSALWATVTTDTSCDWKLDGVSQGRLNVYDAKVVKTTAGEHFLQATSADGQMKWQGMVKADPSELREV